MTYSFSKFPLSVRLQIQVIFFFALILIFSQFGIEFDNRLVEEVNPWIKPSKFAISFIIHCSTTLLIVLLLTPEGQNSSKVKLVIIILLITCIVDLSYISIQAARGRASHFNDDTIIEKIAYTIMGFGGVVVSVAPTFLIPFIRKNGGRFMTPGLRLGFILGLILSAAFTILTAAFMISYHGPFIGHGGSKAIGIPIFGWSTQVGDLRVSHFLSTHLLQIIPFAGWLLDRFSKKNSEIGVWIVAFLTTFVIELTIFQALVGIPFL